MSQFDPTGNPGGPFPPPMPNDPYSSLNYFPGSTEKPAGLVRLAVIFNYISAALDLCLVLLGAGVGVMFLAMPDIPRNPGDPPAAVFAAIYFGMSLLGLGFAITRFIALSIIRRRGPRAWNWGLALGIIGCVQLFVASCICLQAAAGIYTLVIMCRQDVKNYLSTPAPTA